MRLTKPVRVGLLAATVALLSILVLLVVPKRGNERVPVPTGSVWTGTEGHVGEELEDDGISFMTAKIDCGTDYVLKEGKGDANYCLVLVRATNEGQEAITLDAKWQTLGFEGRSYEAERQSENDKVKEWNERFFFSSNAFSAEIEAGQWRPGSLWFVKLNDALRPSYLELHGSSDSEGVRVIFRDCDFEGGCSVQE